MNETLNSLVKDHVNDFPESAQSKFFEIRGLIRDIAEQNGLGQIEETLKWGQPAYLCRFGSTIRVDWNREAESIDVFFNCKTCLVETFKEVFGDEFHYRGNRVIEMALNKPLPRSLESCFLMALNYHRLKKTPLLGA